MNTKDVLLVVGGVALGYFASKMNWGKNTATAVGNVATGVTGVATGVVTDVKDLAVDSAKLVDCTAKLTEKMSTMRLGSAEAVENFRKQFIEECMASK
jgi:hypothetical protein